MNACDKTTSSVVYRPMKAALAAGVSLIVALALVAAATGMARNKSSRAGAARNLQVVGGSSAQRRLARIVAHRVGGVTLRSVRFAPPSRLLRHLHVRSAEMVVTSSQPRTVRGEWDVQLYAGTFIALAERYRVPLGGVSAGEREGPIRLWPAYDIDSRLPTSRQVGALVMRLLDAATRAQARVLEEWTAVAPARAIALTLRVDDPAAFLKHRARRVLNVLWRTKVPLLGYYVGVEDAGGNIVWATSRLPNEGAVFAIPALDACSPVTHSEPALTTPPPCPAK
jgi:hypothetical protein